MSDCKSYVLMCSCLFYVYLYNARNTPASFIIIQRLSSVFSIFSPIFSHTIFSFVEDRQQILFYFTWQTRYFVDLGLSIIKKITDNYKMQISYSCTGNIHEMKLN